MPLRYGLIEPVELCHPDLPPALEGLRVAHVSDLHVRRRFAAAERLANQLTRMRLDLLVLTGDYMEKPGHEAATFEALRQLLGPLRPRLGTFGVFGNHDTSALKQRCEALPVRWLCNQRLCLADGWLELMGLHALDNEEPDSVALLLDQSGHAHAPGHELADDALEAPGRGRERPLRLLLAHSPTSVTTASDLGADFVLCGHTHGGQCRLPTGHALVNSCDLPLRLTAGLLRHRDTQVRISRGIGFTGWVPRLFARPHVPVYTLRCRSMPGQSTCDIENLAPW